MQAHATGTTSGAATVSSGATPATTGGGELALGFYADSGFGDTLTPGTGFTARVNVSPTSDMELLVEDQAVGAGRHPGRDRRHRRQDHLAHGHPRPRAGVQGAPTAPGAPTGVDRHGRQRARRR